MNNLFLSGSKRTGKSSLIRRCLAPYKDVLGGFSSQRLLDVDRNILGYRITDAQDFEVERLYDPELDGIFLLFDRNIKTVDHSLFKDIATKKLIPSEHTSVMLLDEIGGIEMLDPAFRSRLYELLVSDMPCIGVVKEYKDSANNAAGISEADALKKENHLLRKLIDNDTDSCLISTPESIPLFSPEAAAVSAQTERLIGDFLARVIHTS